MELWIIYCCAVVSDVSDVCKFFCTCWSAATPAAPAEAHAEEGRARGSLVGSKVRVVEVKEDTVLVLGEGDSGSAKHHVTSATKRKIPLVSLVQPERERERERERENVFSGKWMTVVTAKAVDGTNRSPGQKAWSLKLLSPLPTSTHW